MRFAIHPLFYALALLLVLFGQAGALVWTFAALAVHEAGHIFAARIRGYVLNDLTLMPYGAMLGLRERMDPRSCVIVGLAGPAANLLSAGLITGVWWLFPAAYAFTRPFLFASLALAAFNLLPVYPLDGSRVVTGLAKNRLRAVKGMQAAGIAFACVLFVSFVVSCALRAVSFTLGAAAVFLFYGAAFGGRKESFIGVLEAGSKNYGAGVSAKRVLISEDAPLIRFFHHVDGRSVTLFEIVREEEGGVRSVRTLSEAELKELAAAGRLSRSLRSALGEEKKRRTPGGRSRC